MLRVKQLWYYFQQPCRVLPKIIYIYLQTFDGSQECIGKYEEVEEIFTSHYFLKRFGNCEIMEMSFDMKKEENNYISILIKGGY